MEELQYMRKCRDNKVFLLHMLEKAFVEAFVRNIDSFKQCRATTLALRVARMEYHPFIFDVLWHTKTRLEFNQRCDWRNRFVPRELWQPHSWDDMEAAFARDHIDLAGVLGPEERDQPTHDDGGEVVLLFTEQQVINCFQNIFCRVLSRVGP